MRPGVPRALIVKVVGVRLIAPDLKLHGNREFLQRHSIEDGIVVQSGGGTGAVEDDIQLGVVREEFVNEG